MQRLLVIFALGLGLLMPACAVQDLPFSGSTAEQDNAAPMPYRPEQGAVHNGSAEGGDSIQPIPADRVPMPTGVAPAPAPATTPAQQATEAQQAHPAAQAHEAPAGQNAPPAAPKPVTRTASGLQEREL